MKMRHIVAVSCIAALASAGSIAQTVGIVTTPPGSFSHSSGSAIAKVLAERAKLRAVVQPQASTGFDEVEAGTADFNLSNSFDVTFYTTGTGEYAGRGAKQTMRQVAALIPYRVAMHVRADSPIKTIADLKGKRVSSEYNAQKTIARIIEAHLANAGMSYNDVQKVPAPNVVRSAEDFKSGRVDVLFFAVGSAAVKEAAASLGGVRVLEISSAADAMKRVQSLLPGAYTLQVSPDPSLDGITRPTTLIAFDMVMISNAKVPDDVVYRVAKAIHDNKKDLVATFPPFGLFQPENMGKPVQSVAFHPGAIRFYKEIGLLK